jgi:hypothetical protein
MRGVLARPIATARPPRPDKLAGWQMELAVCTRGPGFLPVEARERSQNAPEPILIESADQASVVRHGNLSGFF